MGVPAFQVATQAIGRAAAAQSRWPDKRQGKERYVDALLGPERHPRRLKKSVRVSIKVQCVCWLAVCRPTCCVKPLWEASSKPNAAPKRPLGLSSTACACGNVTPQRSFAGALPKSPPRRRPATRPRRPRSDSPRAGAKNATNHAAAPQEGPAVLQAVRRDAQELPDARGDAAARIAAERAQGRHPVDVHGRVPRVEPARGPPAAAAALAEGGAALGVALLDVLRRRRRAGDQKEVRRRPALGARAAASRDSFPPRFSWDDPAARSSSKSVLSDAGSVGARHSLAQQESPRHSRNWQQYHAPVDGDPLEVPANFSWADGMALGSFADDDGIDLGPLDLSN